MENMSLINVNSDQEGYPPSSNELNNFWSEAEYADYRMIVSNAVKLPQDTQKRQNSLFVLVDRFEELDSNFFQFLFEAVTSSEPLFENLPSKLSPKPFQLPIIESAINGLKTVDRGKIIAACASGKTLISLWVSEGLGSSTVLFLAPNLELIRQSIERWSFNANEYFRYIAVCSDNTISDGIEDELLYKSSDIDVPVTTDPEIIKQFLVKEASVKKVVFSTYQSIDSIIEATSRYPDFSFDLAVFDEAHRTAGSKDSGLFSKALNNDAVPVKKRLFMTATERLVKPWIKDKFEQNDRIVFSMDDEDVYGPTFYKLSFGDAIREGIISDYKIVVASIDHNDYKSLINENRYLTTNSGTVQVDEISAQLLFKALLFCNTVKEVSVKKIVSFWIVNTKSDNFFKG